MNYKLKQYLIKINCSFRLLRLKNAIHSTKLIKMWFLRNFSIYLRFNLKHVKGNLSELIHYYFMGIFNSFHCNLFHSGPGFIGV